MKYEYKPAGLDPTVKGKLFWSPLVLTTISGSKNRRKVYALVDSGALYCIAPIEYAEILGASLDKNKAVPTYGVLGTKQTELAYPGKVKVKIEHLDEIEMTVFFMKTNAFAFLLGQKDFFDNFRVKFEKDHKTFEINPVRRK
ncbi:hypothetical protein IIA95_01865 [Patescibacteria group bacterium]|nr:hypothetical protein [Patescibacteria group bacterium]